MAEKGSSSGTKFPCLKCDKSVTRKAKLREHYLSKHKWDYDHDIPATPEILREFREKKKIAYEQQKAKKKEASKKKEENTAEEVFGNISDISESSGQISISSSENEDVEPSDDAKRSAASSKGGERKTVKLTEGKGKLPAPTEKKTPVKWSPSPKPVLEGVDPCVRKQLELKRPPCPIKDYLAARKQSEDVRAEGSSSRTPSKDIADLIPGTSSQTLAAPEIQNLVPFTKNWPSRAQLPSVRDIVGYRNSVPQHVVPADIGKLTAVKFGWEGENTISSEKYVRGVIAGHDFARRDLLDGLRGFLRDKPTNPEEAHRRWSWLTEWAERQPRPPTPEQDFED